MRRPFREALMSVGSVALLLGVLISLDPDVREQVSRRIAQPSLELASWSRQISHVTSVIASSARGQSLSHAPLLIFTLAATVLVLFMLRT